MTRRLLFIGPTRIGDGVLATGILNHLVASEPDLRVTVACGPLAAPLYETAPNLERLIVMTKRKRAGHWLDLWRQVIGTRWHRVVDLRRSAMPWLVATTHRHSAPPDRPVHRVVLNAEAIGCGDGPPAPVLWTQRRHHQIAARLLPPGGPVLGVGPAANWAAKTWPIENWRPLIERLTGPGGPLPGARVAVFGAPGEREAVAPLVAALPRERCIDLVGGAELLTVAAALGRCSLFVGNDSALMHMASAMGTPTLGLFGPTDDVRYGPWGPCTAVVRTPTDYAGWVEYMRDPSFDHRTTGTLMDSLPVEAVEAAARDLLERLKP